MWTLPCLSVLRKKLTDFKIAKPRRRIHFRTFAESLESRIYLSAVPAEISTLSLANDTGQAGDLITEDATLLGTTTNDGSVSGLEIEFDFDGDGYTDDWFTTDADGTFSYDPTSWIWYGQYTVNARVAEYDINTGDYLYSDWVSLSFTYEAPPNDPAVLTLSLANDTGQVGDLITEDATLLGTTTNDGSVSGLEIEFDFDGDGYTDDWFTTDADGTFSYDPTSWIWYGQYTVNARVAEYDINTGDYLYSDWVSLSFTYEAPPNDPAELTLSLANDTGHAGDLITEDATLLGTTTNDGSVSGLEIEFDFDGDGYTDDWFTTDADGTFSYDPTSWIWYGQYTVNARVAEYDNNTGDYLYSDWVSLSFTYEAPPNDPAVLTLSLANDTGHAGDLITEDATLLGTTTNDGSVSGLEIEFDFDGDGYTDDWFTTDADGTFSYDPTSWIWYGQYTVNARVAEYDINTGDYLYSDWVSLSFTYEAPPNDPAVLTLSLANDTGQVGDLITEDATLLGTTTNDGSVSGLEIEFDFDGDGSTDDWFTTDADGTFSYDPTSWTSYGQNTVYARVAEYDINTGDYLYSSWVSLSFTYNESLT